MKLFVVHHRSRGTYCAMREWRAQPQEYEQTHINKPAAARPEQQAQADGLQSFINWQNGSQMALENDAVCCEAQYGDA